MRALQPRAWLSGLGQASRSPWRQESLPTICSSAKSHAEAEVQPADNGDGDAQFLQLLSRSFSPAQIGDSAPATRPLLANLPAAAELMEQAVPQTPTTEPVYDLPNFLASSYPHAGVHPRNPAYDWRVWARSNLAVAPRAASSAIAQQQQQRWDAQQQLSLLLQIDAHMQLPASREVITRLAKLELAHLWYYQQQQLQQQAAGSGAAVAGGSGAAQQQQATEFGSGSAAAAAVPAEAAPSTASPATSAADVDTAAAAEDDIFAAADRKAREKKAAAAAAAAAAQQQQQAVTAPAAGAGNEAAQIVRDPLTSLPPEVQLRLREMQRRAEAFGGQRGALADVVRTVGEAFGKRVPSDLPPASAEGPEALTVAPAAPASTGRRAGKAGATPADVAVKQQEAPPQYWADHPLLAYHDIIVALAHRESAAARRAAAAGPAGAESVAAAVAALSASSSAPPATPVLSLLVDYLSTKYQDLVHAWEVTARLEEATERSERAAARERATLAVPASPEARLQQLLPPALASELEATWGQQQSAPASSPSSLASWQQAKELLLQQAAKVSAASSSSSSSASSSAAVPQEGGSSADLRSDAERAMAPLLAAAAARHSALLRKSNGADNSSSSGAAAPAAAAAVPKEEEVSVTGPAAGVVCFRETLMLDASSAFEDGSHDARVSLEFSLARLASLEPALGGDWGRGFLRRLMGAPVWADAAGSGGAGPVGRRRRGDVVRSATMAAAYPQDVDRSYCRRTDTAVLSTARYGSREANRKLLLEHYAALLRVTAAAAKTAGSA